MIELCWHTNAKGPNPAALVVAYTLRCLVVALLVVGFYSLIPRVVTFGSELVRDFGPQLIIGADTELGGDYRLVTKAKWVISIWSKKKRELSLTAPLVELPSRAIMSLDMPASVIGISL